MAPAYPYRATAILKYKPPPGHTGGLVLAKGDAVEVVGAEDEDAEWLRGRKDDGTEGIFPEQFVEAVEDAPVPDAASRAPVPAAPAFPPASEAAQTTPPPPSTSATPHGAAAPAPVPVSSPSTRQSTVSSEQQKSDKGDEKSNLSFKDRLAAFNRPAAAPPPVPRAKPAALSRKPPTTAALSAAAVEPSPSPAPAPTSAPAPAPTATAPADPPRAGVTSQGRRTEAADTDRGSSMSAADAASSIKAAGSLKERMAALQGLSIETPGLPGRAPKPRKKPQAEEAAATEVDPSPAEPGETSTVGPEPPMPDPLSPTPASPIERTLSPPVATAPASVAMPAVPRRAGPPRRKAPSASSSIDVPPTPTEESRVAVDEPPDTTPVESRPTESPVEQKEAEVPTKAEPTADLAVPRANNEQALPMPSTNATPLGIVSEQPGAESELEAAEIAEDDSEERGGVPDLPSLSESPRLPSTEPLPSTLSPPLSPAAHTAAVEAAEAEPSLAAVEADEPKFGVENDEDVAIVPADSDDLVDEDVAEDHIESRPATTESAELPPSTTSTAEPASMSPRPRGVPSPKGPRAFVNAAEARAEPTSASPAAPAPARPPPVPAPFTRQMTEEHVPTVATSTSQRAQPSPAAPKADVSEGREISRQTSSASQSDAGQRPSSATATTDLQSRSRHASRASHDSSDLAAPTSPVAVAPDEEDEIDPEIARRQALAKRMAALGGVKIGSMPMFGRPMPRQAPSVPDEPIESPQEQPTSPTSPAPAAPRRMPGLPAGAVPIFGMARSPPPMPVDHGATSESAADLTGRRSIEPDENQSSPKIRPPSIPPPARPAPPPAPMSTGSVVEAKPVEPVGDADIESTFGESEDPVPPPPPRPRGGHAPRSSIDASRSSFDDAREMPTRRTSGSPTLARASIDESGPIPRFSSGGSGRISHSSSFDQGPPPIPGNRPRPSIDASPRLSMNSKFEEPGARSRQATGSSVAEARASPAPVPISSFGMSPRFSAEPDDMPAPLSPRSPKAPQEIRALPQVPSASPTARPVPSRAELDDLSERIGASLHAKATRRLKEGARFDQGGVAFVSSLISEIPDSAPPPTHGGGFGISIWHSSTPDAVSHSAHIRPGDVFVVEGGQPVKLKGKGIGASSTTLPPGYAAIVEEDFDPKKRKLRVIELNDKGRVDHASYPLDSIKNGALSVYRILDRARA